MKILIMSDDEAAEVGVQQECWVEDANDDVNMVLDDIKRGSSIDDLITQCEDAASMLMSLKLKAQVGRRAQVDLPVAELIRVLKLIPGSRIGTSEELEIFLTQLESL